MAKGAFPESHELHFGWPGMHGPKWSNWAMNKSDLLVAVGARFDDRVTGKLVRVRARARPSSTSTSTRPRSRSSATPTSPSSGRSSRCSPSSPRELEPGGRVAPSRGCGRSPTGASEFPLRYAQDGDLLKPQHVLETLQELTAGRDDVIWTTGVGQHQMWAMQYLACDRPRTFITSGGLGTMGYGIPAAIGAKAARPDATVVCVDGDGCFQMTQQELATAVLEELPIVVVIVNNGYLGMVRQWQDMFFEERFSQIHLTHESRTTRRSPAPTARSGFTVETEDELEAALHEALASGRTASSTPASTRASTASR